MEDDAATIKETFPSYDAETKTFSEPDGDIFHTELRVVVPNEESPLKPEMFREETKFYYYPEFREWLEQGLLRGYGIGETEPWTRFAEQGYV